MRLEKLITTNPISDFFTETFGLLSAGQFESLVFRPRSQGGQICVPWISRRRRRRTNSQIQIQAPPNAPRDEILPRGNPRCWQIYLFSPKALFYCCYPATAVWCYATLRETTLQFNLASPRDKLFETILILNFITRTKIYGNIRMAEKRIVAPGRDWAPSLGPGRPCVGLRSESPPWTPLPPSSSPPIKLNENEKHVL